jgi:Ni,Fe-hydrogenase III large subunit
VEIPRRAQMLRVICAELNRIGSHLLWGELSPAVSGYELVWEKAAHLGVDDTGSI